MGTVEITRLSGKHEVKNDFIQVLLFVSLVAVFVAAERTGNWPVYLLIAPIFAALVWPFKRDLNVTVYTAPGDIDIYPPSEQDAVRWLDGDKWCRRTVEYPTGEVTGLGEKIYAQISAWVPNAHAESWVFVQGSKWLSVPVLVPLNHADKAADYYINLSRIELVGALTETPADEYELEDK